MYDYGRNEIDYSLDLTQSFILLITRSVRSDVMSGDGPWNDEICAYKHTRNKRKRRNSRDLILKLTVILRSSMQDKIAHYPGQIFSASLENINEVPST